MKRKFKYVVEVEDLGITNGYDVQIKPLGSIKKYTDSGLVDHKFCTDKKMAEEVEKN